MWQIATQRRVAENIAKATVAGQGIELHFLLFKLLFQLLDLLGELHHLFEMVGQVLRDGAGICHRELCVRRAGYSQGECEAENYLLHSVTFLLIWTTQCVLSGAPGTPEAIPKVVPDFGNDLVQQLVVVRAA